MSLEIDLFWSFRSPYSYLATPRLRALSEEFDLRVNVRPVYPLAVRKKGFFEAQDPLWIPYLLRDTMRTAEYLGLKFRWPRPDPVVIDPATRDAKPDQPYIHRLTRLGVAAAEAGRGIAFLDEVSRVIWSGEVDDWHQGEHLAAAAKRAGLDLPVLDAKLAAETERLEAVIEANQAAHRQSGHWGVPTMAFKGEPFFGQDRVEQLVWRLKANGLSRR